jgi:hypothetical protein
LTDTVGSGHGVSPLWFVVSSMAPK